MSNEFSMFHNVPVGNTNMTGTTKLKLKLKPIDKSLVPNVPKKESEDTDISVPYYRFFFTLKKESMTQSDLLTRLKEIAKEFTFQLEKGKDGYEHWQGVFSLKTKERFMTCKNHFPNTIHLERCKDWFASRNYCSKSETHIDGPWSEKSSNIKIITDLYDWQKQLEDICLTEPNDRTIHWVYDYKGNAGKTQFCKYMFVKHGATILQNGAFKDLAFALPDNPKICLFNITRDLENKMNYSALEAIKDGMLFSGKYESKMKIFNSPHVIVFANFKPRFESLSEDRWNLITLSEPKCEI